MKKRILLAPLLLSLIMISTTMLPAAATDYKVGVKVGDTADYTASDPTPNGLLTGTFYIEILKIAGVNVTFEFRPVYDPNNLEGYDNILTHNVSSGYQILPDGSSVGLPPPYLVAANLSQGDNIFQEYSWGFTWSPIKTITMIVAGQYRTVNYVKYTGIYHLPILGPGDKWSWSYEAYYDKATGLLVATNWTRSGRISPYQNGSKASYITMLTSTTAFTGLNSTGPTILPTILPPEETTVAPLITAAGFALIAVSIATLAITQRRRHKTTTD